MRVLIPLLIMLLIIGRHQRIKGRPSVLACALVLYLLGVAFLRLPWPL